MPVRIIGTGSYVPEKIVTNEDLEKLVDTSDAWITERTGIHTRRVTGEGTAAMAVRAAGAALERAGMEPEEKKTLKRELEKLLDNLRSVDAVMNQEE